MALWKKLIYSGSTAQLNNLYVTNAVTASYFEGNGAAITGVVSASFATSASWAPSQPAVSSSYAATASVSQLFKPNVINGGEIGQTNYAFNPTGINDASMVLLSGTGSFGVLGGIAGNYKSLTLVNTGSYAICLEKYAVSASSANKFALQDDVMLFPNESIQFYYNNINNVWCPAGYLNTYPKLYDRQQRAYFILRDNSGTSPEGWTQLYGSGASFNFVFPTGDVGVFLIISTGTSSTGNGYLYKTTDTMFATSSPIRTHLKYKTKIYIPTLSDGTNQYTVRAGIAYNTTIFIASITYSSSVNSGKFRLEYNNGSTTSDSGITVAANTIYDLEIIARPNGVITYYINNVFVGQLSGTFTSQRCGPVVSIHKSLGTTSRDVYINYVEMVETRV